MPNYNLIQIRQVNQPEFSGYILEVVAPYTGAGTSPSGSDGQIQYKSGEFFAGSDLYFTGGKFSYGFSTPEADFHLSGKDFTVTSGTGEFSYLFVDGDRVIASTEFNATGQFLDGLIDTLSGFVTSNYYTQSYIDTGFYPSSNPSGYAQETGVIMKTGTNDSQLVLAAQIFS